MEKSSITIIGTGGTDAGFLTIAAREALDAADVVIGVKRLASFAKEAPVFAEAWKPKDILEVIEKHPNERICVLFSGDTGFYSGAAGLGALLREKEIPFRLLPGISSVQLLSAAIGEPWESWKLVSAHGRAVDPAAGMDEESDTLFLTDTSLSPERICCFLAKAGHGSKTAVVGSRLGGPGAAVFSGTVAEAAKKEFPQPSVLLVRAEQCGTGRAVTPHEAENAVTPNATRNAAAVVHEEATGSKAFVPEQWRDAFLLPDTAFIRGSAPMTKQEVRAAILLALMPKDWDIIWDIGAGTGSVSVEMARHMKRGRVFSVEYQKDALRLLEENANLILPGQCACMAASDLQADGALCDREEVRLCIVNGMAPEACRKLPVPDAVFLGGSSGRMTEILDAVFAKNEHCRVVISAILTETFAEATAYFKKAKRPYTVTQLAVSSSKPLGDRHMMTAENPVWIIRG